MAPHPFKKASTTYSALFNAQNYLERTKRNHFWLGGPEGQNALRGLRIAVAGVGGIGGQIAELLVRLGVGHLRIADPDHIETSNLNRQTIANLGNLGAPKAEAAAKQLRSIAEDFELVVYNEGVTSANSVEFVEGCDAVVDEIDVFSLERHIDLHRAARSFGLPTYSAFVVGLGTHFYKFQGTDFTFEDFLACSDELLRKPTAKLLLDRFGKPYPEYLSSPRMIQAYTDEIATSGAPIFGPATLLGQSLVVTRMILDLLRNKSQLPETLLKGPSTPVMPEMLVLDPLDLTFTKARMNR